jgi:hypothetical protein
MLFPVGKHGANNPLAFLINNHVHFYCMPLFLPGIPELLPLFRRALGVSVASTRMTSYITLAFKQFLVTRQ